MPDIFQTNRSANRKCEWPECKSQASIAYVNNCQISYLCFDHAYDTKYHAERKCMDFKQKSEKEMLGSVEGMQVNPKIEKNKAADINQAAHDVAAVKKMLKKVADHCGVSTEPAINDAVIPYQQPVLTDIEKENLNKLLIEQMSKMKLGTGVFVSSGTVCCGQDHIPPILPAPTPTVDKRVPLAHDKFKQQLADAGIHITPTLPPVEVIASVNYNDDGSVLINKLRIQVNSKGDLVDATNIRTTIKRNSVSMSSRSVLTASGPLDSKPDVQLPPGTYYSVIPGFRRWLVCKNCKNRSILSRAFNDKRADVVWSEFAFTATCVRCSHRGTTGVHDELDKSVQPFIKVWHPPELLRKPVVDKETNKASVEYIWRIPEDYRKLVTSGDKFVLQHAPWEVIECVRDGYNLEIDPDMIEKEPEAKKHGHAAMSDVIKAADILKTSEPYVDKYSSPLERHAAALKLFATSELRDNRGIPYDISVVVHNGQIQMIAKPQAADC